MEESRRSGAGGRQGSVSSGLCARQTGATGRSHRALPEVHRTGRSECLGVLQPGRRAHAFGQSAGSHIRREPSPGAQPEHALTESNLAATLLQSGRTDEAIEHIRKALDLDPEFADAHNMLAIVLARAGKLDDAVEHLRKAVSNTPDSLEYRFNLGRVLAARHSFAEAAPELEKAVELSGGNEPQSLEMLAAMYSELGRFAEAAQTARRALAIAERENDVARSQALRTRIAYYEAQRDGAGVKR